MMLQAVTINFTEYATRILGKSDSIEKTMQDTEVTTTDLSKKT